MSHWDCHLLIKGPGSFPPNAIIWCHEAIIHSKGRAAFSPLGVHLWSIDTNWFSVLWGDIPEDRYMCWRGWEVKFFDSFHRSVLVCLIIERRHVLMLVRVLLEKEDQATNHRAGSRPSLATCPTFELRKVSNLPLLKKIVRLDIREGTQRGEW